MRWHTYDATSNIYLQIAQGGKIPSSYFLKEKISLDREKMEKVTLQKGTKFDLKFHAKEPEVIIR